MQNALNLYFFMIWGVTPPHLPPKIRKNKKFKKIYFMQNALNVFIFFMILGGQTPQICKKKAKGKMLALKIQNTFFHFS